MNEAKGGIAECGFGLLGFKGQRDVESAAVCVEISEDNSFWGGDDNGCTIEVLIHQKKAFGMGRLTRRYSCMRGKCNKPAGT